MGLNLCYNKSDYQENKMEILTFYEYQKILIKKIKI